MDLSSYESGGITIYVRKNETSWDEKVADEVIRGDVYRLKDFKAAHPTARTFVDIGANIGAFAVFVKRLWPNARVFCAEPLQQNFNVLKENVKNINGVALFERAVIAGSDELIGFQGPSHITKPESHDKNFADGHVSRESPTKVYACTLPDIIGEDVVDFMKLDCEGGEIEILESIKGTPYISRIKTIRGEWHGHGAAELLAASLSPTHNFKVTSVLYSNLGMFEADLKG